MTTKFASCQATRSKRVAGLLLPALRRPDGVRVAAVLRGEPAHERAYSPWRLMRIGKVAIRVIGRNSKVRGDPAKARPCEGGGAPTCVASSHPSGFVRKLSENPWKTLGNGHTI